MFTDARNLCLLAGSFDIALCGFMGWNDFFDFIHLEFTQPERKATEIHRILRDKGRFVCCSWEAQEDLAWMEEAILRYYPALLQDGEYLQERPIGVAYEKARGYEIIFRAAGFREIEVSKETAEFISTDEEEWWQQMQHIGWDPFFDKISKASTDKMQKIKEAVFKDIQPHKQPDGIHFTKTVFYVCGVK